MASEYTSNQQAFLEGFLTYCTQQDYDSEKTAELLEKTADIFDQGGQFVKAADAGFGLGNLASTLLPTALISNIILDKFRQRQHDLDIWQQITPFLLAGTIAGGAGTILYPIVKKVLDPIQNLAKKEYDLDKRIESMKQFIRLQEAAEQANQDKVVDATNPGRRAIAL